MTSPLSPHKDSLTGRRGQGRAGPLQGHALRPAGRGRHRSRARRTAGGRSVLGRLWDACPCRSPSGPGGRKRRPVVGLLRHPPEPRRHAEQPHRVDRPPSSSVPGMAATNGGFPRRAPSMCLPAYSPACFGRLAWREGLYAEGVGARSVAPPAFPSARSTAAVPLVWGTMEAGAAAPARGRCPTRALPCRRPSPDTNPQARARSRPRRPSSGKAVAVYPLRPGTARRAAALRRRRTRRWRRSPGAPARG